MELIYIWIDEYRKFQNQEINLSNKFTVKYKKEDNTILIKENINYCHIYPDNISFSAFVGKNGVGKSNILDLIGMRIYDRNKLGDEFEIIYNRKEEKNGFLCPDDVEQENKNSRYFLLYYLGESEDGDKQFCFEGNDICSYLELFKNKDRIYNQDRDETETFNYWTGKYWFAFIVKATRDYKLDYICHLQNYVEVDVDNHLQRKDRLAIVLFRDNYNLSYYDSNSFNPKDEPKIAIPRRIAYLKSELLHKKVEFLINQMKVSNREIYLDNEYILIIKYPKRYEYTDIYNDIEFKNILKKDNDRLSNDERCICKLLLDFCLCFSNWGILNNDNNQENIEKINKQLKDVESKDYTYLSIKQYISNVFEELLKIKFDEDSDKDYPLKAYKELEGILDEIMREKLDEFEFADGYIKIKLNKDSNKKLISELIEKTIDERVHRNKVKEDFSIFADFFEYKIDHLSDGEFHYLGLMSSLEEQIDIFTQNNAKNKYILLIDEPESNMHPELARRFVNELIKFLSQYNHKKFQIIFATHSPFLISDIPNDNILTISKSSSEPSKIDKYKLNSFGQNIHSLLKNTFFMEYTMGQYSIDTIKRINECLTEQEVNKDEFLNKVKRLNNNIDNIDDAIKYLGALINKIGEPIIKNELRRRLNTISISYKTVGEQIEFYEKKIQELKKGVDDKDD